ncbi:MAG: 50S ribosomal protein L13 [Candidatus Doudnabacteria bacterium]|nr:50S ribosomal protein L13 [Candidatus Doudnabacteria bacterium]
MTLPKSVLRTWYQIDASAAPMGRIASRIANVLRGKHKRQFTPHIDMGDFVVAVNVDKLKFTGRKIEQKKYFRHSGYLGGIKSERLGTVLQKSPGEALKRAVFSMVDDLKFRRKLVGRLKLVTGEKHGFKIDKALQLNKNN